MNRPTRSELSRLRDATLTNLLTERVAELQDLEERNVRRSISYSVAKDSLLIKQIEDLAEKLFKAHPIKPSKYALKKGNKKTSRHLHLDISDTHIRAMLDPDELPYRYMAEEEARRLAKIAQEVVDFKTHYRDQTALNVNILGDIFQGQLHDPRDGAPMAEQWCAALHLLTQLLSFLASHFKQVYIRCATGNHGRNLIRHKSRAIHQKWDSLETKLYFALKKALAGFPNVIWDIPKTPYFVYNSLGHYILGTHGDTFINVGNPGTNIKVVEVSKRINEINASRAADQRIEVVTTGHVHVSSRTRLNNGVVLITNGALIPPDGFMVNGIGKLEMTNCQALWESTQKYVAGDFRELTVDTETDADASLDTIIKPFTNFND